MTSCHAAVRAVVPNGSRCDHRHNAEMSAGDQAGQQEGRLPSQLNDLEVLGGRGQVRAGLGPGAPV